MYIEQLYLAGLSGKLKEYVTNQMLFMESGDVLLSLAI